MELPTIAVTGATGFVGRHLLKQLDKYKYPVSALTRKPQLQQDQGLTWVQGDLDNKLALEKLLNNSDILIHCAGQTRGQTYSDFAHTNVKGVKNILNVLQDTSTKLLLISSLAAREQHLSHYALSKKTGENLLQLSALNWTIFRPPAIYGPGDKELTPLLKIMLNGILPMPSHRGKLSLLFITDLVAAIIAWLDSTNSRGKCYELHDGHGYSWQEIATVGSLWRGGKVRPLKIPQKLFEFVAFINESQSRLKHKMPMLNRGKVREIQHLNWVCDNQAICHDLDWQPQFDLLKGLQNTYSSS